MKKFLYKKKLLLYTGYQNFSWNPESFSSKAMGGTEAALYNLSKCFNKLGYEVFVVGDVIEGDYDGVKYRTSESMHKSYSNDRFHAIIATSYIHYLEEFKNFNFNKSFLCIHNTDTSGGWWFPWWRGESLPNQGLDLLQSPKLTNIVCLTNWHRDKFCEAFPNVSSKVKILGNAVDLNRLPKPKPKKPQTFIYSSHAERGLEILLSNWGLIKSQIPNSTLKICTPAYGLSYFEEIKKKFSHLKNYGVSFLGALSQSELYDIIAETDYWLYPTRYEETYCITALEMQALGTFILTSKFSALRDTVSDRGVLIDLHDNDSTFFKNFLKELFYLESNLEKKQEILIKAKNWAYLQSWENRSIEWVNLIELN